MDTEIGRRLQQLLQGVVFQITHVDVWAEQIAGDGSRLALMYNTGERCMVLKLTLVADSGDLESLKGVRIAAFRLRRDDTIIEDDGAVIYRVGSMLFADFEDLVSYGRFRFELLPAEQQTPAVAA
jgi:hypothetical protein